MVRHLPPTIRQLLTLRNLDAFVGPSASRLDYLFDKTQNDARLKGAGTGWLVLTVHDLTLTSPPNHLPNGGLDLHAVDSKHSLVCRPFISLRIAF
jgi:hypothetical protein